MKAGLSRPKTAAAVADSMQSYEINEDNNFL